MTYTKEELSEFDALTSLLHSRSQTERIHGRFEVRKFVEKHGKEKCDAMFEVLQAKDAKRR